MKVIKVKLSILMVCFSAVLLSASVIHLNQYKRYLTFIKMPKCFEWNQKYSHVFKANCEETIRVEGQPLILKTNELGLREKSIAEIAKAGILLIGDSQIEGVGLRNEDTFGAQLSNVFRQDDKQLEFINGGLRRTSALTQVVRMKDLVSRFEPSYVIWTITENDYDDDFMSLRRATSFDQNNIPTSYDLWFYRKIMPPWLYDFVMFMDSFDVDTLSIARHFVVRYFVSKQFETWQNSDPICDGYTEGIRFLKSRKIPFIFVSVPFGPDYNAFFQSESDLKNKLKKVESCVQAEALIQLDQPELSEVKDFFQQDYMHLNAKGVEKAIQMMRPRLQAEFKKAGK